MTFLHRFGILIQHSDYHNFMISAMALESGKVVGQNILHIGDDQFDDDLKESDVIWDQLADRTCWREWYAASCQHELQPPDSLTDGEAAHATKLRLETQRALDECKMLLQFNLRDFRRGSHLCKEGRCKYYPCDPDTWRKNFNSAYTELLRLMGGGMNRVAKTRMLSWCRLLAFATFGIKVCELLPRGWLRK